MQSGRPHQILQAEHLYGTPQGLIRNASILVDPDGSIAAVGPSDAIERERRERESADPTFHPTVHRHEVILPALTDTHNHPMLWGEFQALQPASLSGISDEAHLAESLRAQFDGKSGLQLALGWDTSTLPGLNRGTLDAIRREPFVVMDTSFHGACANSEALSLIDRHLDDNGLRGQLAGGMTLDGRLTEQYSGLGFVLLEAGTDVSTLARSVEEYVRAQWAGGTAYTHDMHMSTMKQLEVVSLLPQEVRESIRVLHVSPELMRAMVASGRDVSGYHLKLFADGSNGSRTALYYEPYIGTDNRGIQYHREAEVSEAIDLALDHGSRNLSTHAIGDRGIDVALGFCEMWQRACRAKGIDGQARVEHMSVPRPESITRAAGLGVSVSPQPNFIPDMIPFKDRLDDERIRRMVPLRKMIDAGIRVMIGTDGMPNSMLLALHCAVTAPCASQRISLEEAIHCATATAPQYERAERGTIEVGQPANFLLTTHRMIERLTQDSGLFECEPQTYVAKMDEIAADLAKEVRGVMRRGESL